LHEIQRLRDEQSLLGDEARGDKQALIDRKLGELDAFDVDVRRTLGKERNTAVREVFEDIEGALQEYGERKGYDYIINDRALLYRSDRHDVTKDVLKELKSNYKKKK